MGDITAILKQINGNKELMAQIVRLMAAGIGMGIAAAMNAVFWMLDE